MRALIVVKSQKCTPSINKSLKVIGVGCVSVTTTTAAGSSSTRRSLLIGSSATVQSERTMSSVVSNKNITSTIVSNHVVPSTNIILGNTIVNNNKNGINNGSTNDSPWSTFGTVIGLTSALAVGGLYIEQQQQQQQSQENQLKQIESKVTIQNINSNEISSCSNSSNGLLSLFQNNLPTMVSTDNDVDTYPVDKYQQQQQSLYSSGNIRLLSTSPSAIIESVSSSLDTEEFVDKYDNLPETDPPTDCGMCKIFRKGPCRNQWRKFEYCIKDNSDNFDECLPYLVHHKICSKSYGNLYSLVFLDDMQEDIDTLQNDINESERRYWPCSKSNSIVHMDWGNWPDFVSKEGLNFTQLTDTNSTSTVPLYKRFPEGLDPIIFHCTTSIPRTLNDTNNTKEQNDYILKTVWVTDQDGMVLGKYSSERYKALYRQTKDTEDIQPKDNKDEEKKQDDDNDDKYQLEDDERCICYFSIIPGSTKQVIVHGMYSENPLKVSPTKEKWDVLLYTSKPYCMKKASTERTS